MFFLLHISIQFYSKFITLKLNSLFSVFWGMGGVLKSRKTTSEQWVICTRIPPLWINTIIRHSTLTVHKVFPARGIITQQFVVFLLSQVTATLLPCVVRFVMAIVGVAIPIGLQRRPAQAQKLLEGNPEIWAPAVDEGIEGRVDVAHPVQEDVNFLRDEVILDHVHNVDDEKGQPAQGESAHDDA